ncbi:MAG: hypothetical protein AAF211_03955 [Myxococcota bacterium]
MKRQLRLVLGTMAWTFLAMGCDADVGATLTLETEIRDEQCRGGNVDFRPEFVTLRTGCGVDPLETVAAATPVITCHSAGNVAIRLSAQCARLDDGSVQVESLVELQRECTVDGSREDRDVLAEVSLPFDVSPGAVDELVAFAANGLEEEQGSDCGRSPLEWSTGGLAIRASHVSTGLLPESLVP